MKNKFNLYLVVTILSVLLAGCYSDTVDSLRTFKFQIPLNFRSNFIDKAAPDTSWDFVNLENYKEYNDNKERIKEAEVYQFTYWIDSLELQNKIPFNPNRDDVEFMFIKFYLQFAKPKPGYSKSDPNPDHWARSNGPMHLLGEFPSVKVKDYYKRPNQVIQVSDEVSKVLSKAIKDSAQFFILSEYSKVKGQTEPKRIFPLINARYDLVIRLNVGID